MSGVRATELLVWGATGITGKSVCLELAKRYAGRVRWSIAGRNEQKLQSLKSELIQYHDSLKDLPVVVANIENRESVAAMVRQTQVVLACAGPFPLYSDTVVEACVDEGTHVLDVTGETPWVRSVIDRLNEKAKEKGIKVINCCGFDSVPADIATYGLVEHTYKRYGRGLSKALGCYKVHSPSKTPFSGGTLASVISLSKLDKQIKKEQSHPFYLNPVEKKPGKTEAKDRFWLEFDKEFGFWTSPFPMEPCNSRIVHRSAALLSRPHGNGFYYGECIRGNSFLSALGSCLFLIILGFVLMCPPIRGLLFALGILPKPGEGPSTEEEKKSKWELTVHGLIEPDASDPSGKPIVVQSQISDSFGSYTSTAKMMTECGLAILHNKEALKKEGLPESGVLTPASALGNVLIQRLTDIGIKTRILQE